MAMGISASARTTLARFSWTGGLHLLLLGHGEGAALLGLGPGDPRVGLGLQGLEVGADVVADVDVGDVDREDLVGGAGVEPLLEHALGDRVGLLQHLQVRLGRADGVDDALADPGDDRFVGGPADQAVEVGPHRHLRLDLELDAVLGHAVDRVPARSSGRGRG